MNRVDVLRHERVDYSLTIHGMNGSFFFQSCMMVLHAIFAFLLCIGWRTRLMQFLVYLWTMSLHIHAPYVGHGGDTYCRVILFFSLFLPLGKVCIRKISFCRVLIPSISFILSRKVWSVDSAMKHGLSTGKNTRGHTFASVGNVASAAFIYQVMTMYMVSTFLKTGLEWYELNTASFWALRLKYFATPLGDFLAQFPDILRFLTWAVLKWEFWGPLMFISPVFPQFMRLFACFGFIALHVSFGLCLRLGFFTFITNTTILALLPSCVWNFLSAKVWSTEARRHSSVGFSTRSSFSRCVALILKRFLLTCETETYVLEEKASTGAELEPSQSSPRVWLHVHEPFRRQSLSNMEALFYVLRYLSPLTSIPLTCVNNNFASQELRSHTVVTRTLWFLSKSFIRRLEDFSVALHDFTAMPDSGSLPRGSYSPAGDFLRRTKKSTKIFLRRLIYVYLAWMMICILGENLNHIGYPMGFPPRSTHWMVYSTRTDQNWNMFCPRPPRKSFYYVMPGKLMDDTPVELWRNGGITWETWEPTLGEIDWSEPDIPYTFYNHRWFKHMENGFNSAHEFPKQRFGQWVCREFNSRTLGNRRLKSFEVWISFLEAQEDGSYDDSGHSKIWDQDCFLESPFLFPLLILHSYYLTHVYSAFPDVIPHSNAALG
jgi:hypothetical protein